MQAAEYHTLRHMEDRHWWYSVLHGLVLDELNGMRAEPTRLLDAGCGTGGMMAKLGRWKSVGVDREPAAVLYSMGRGLKDVEQASVNELPFASASFDVVLSLDVLYHAEVDEERALMEMQRVLRADGRLILNVPAFEQLRGAHDAAVGGARRYTLERVRELLAKCNLRIEMIHYWNAWLALPMMLWRRWRRSEVSDLSMPPQWANKVLAMMGKFDARCCRALHLPFGSSVFAVASKV